VPAAAAPAAALAVAVAAAAAEGTTAAAAASPTPRPQKPATAPGPREGTSFFGRFCFLSKGGGQSGWKREGGRERGFCRSTSTLAPPPKKINKSKFQNSDVVSWITWFCSLKGNEFFCEVRDRSICGERNSWREEEKKRSAREREGKKPENLHLMKNDQSKNSEKLSTLQVDEDYIQDDFNLSGLGAQVPYYDYALDLILDADAPGADRLTEEQHELVESAAEVLYGLIHARFVLTGEFIPDVFFCLPAESSDGERREGGRAKKKKKGGKRDAFSKKKKNSKFRSGPRRRPREVALGRLRRLPAERLRGAASAPAGALGRSSGGDGPRLVSREFFFFPCLPSTSSEQPLLLLPFFSFLRGKKKLTSVPLSFLLLLRLLLCTLPTGVRAARTFSSRARGPTPPSTAPTSGPPARTSCC